MEAVTTCDGARGGSRRIHDGVDARGNSLCLLMEDDAFDARSVVGAVRKLADKIRKNAHGFGLKEFLQCEQLLEFELLGVIARNFLQSLSWRE